MCPRSGLRSGGTSVKTYPRSRCRSRATSEILNVPSFRFSFRANIRQNHPFWKTTLREPPKIGTGSCDSFRDRGPRQNLLSTSGNAKGPPIRGSARWSLYTPRSLRAHFLPNPTLQSRSRAEPWPVQRWYLAEPSTFPNLKPWIRRRIMLPNPGMRGPFVFAHYRSSKWHDRQKMFSNKICML